MKNDLVETVKFCFTSKVVSQLGELVNEPTSGVAKTLAAAIPLVLNGLLSQAARGVAPAALLELVRAANSAAVLVHLQEGQPTQPYEPSTNLLLDALSDTYRATVNQLAADAGIQPANAGMLLHVAATAVLGVLGRFAVANDLTPAEFVHWLQSQQDLIAAEMLPAFRGSGLATQFNALPASRQPAPVPPRMVNAPIRPTPEALGLPAGPAPRPANGLLSWQAGALLLLTLGLGYGFGRYNATPTDQPVAQQPAGATAVVATAPAVAPAGALTTAAPTAVAPTDSALAAPVAAAPAEALPATAAAANAPVAVPPAAPAPVVAPPVDKLAAAMVAATATRPPAAQPVAERPAPARTAERAGNDDNGRNAAPASNRNAEAGGAAETRLYKFLATPTVRVDSVNRTKGWIDLDHVSFEPGQTTLTPESSAQLASVARVLRSFPNSVVKIGGYTDSTGAGPQDLQFSEARARAVMTALSGQGVRLHRLFAQGYGSKYAVAPNTTPANRAQNRRVSIRVLKK